MAFQRITLTSPTSGLEPLVVYRDRDGDVVMESMSVRLFLEPSDENLDKLITLLQAIKRGAV